MKKLLDEAFCEYATAKKILDPPMISELKGPKGSPTVRESLLLKGQISLQMYAAILSELKKDNRLVDTEKSKEYDRIFLKYGQDIRKISMEDISACQEQSFTSPISTRELLLISGIMSYEIYSGLVRNLTNSEAKAVTAKAEPDATPEVSGNQEEGLAIVSDNSAETILDINPFEPEDPLISAMENAQNPFEDSEDTLIDYEDLHGESEVRCDEPTLDISSTTINDKVSAPRSHTKKRKKAEIMLEASEPESLEKSEIESLGHTRARNYSESDIVKRYHTREGIAPDIMEGIIRKVQEEVNLQTQRISKDVVKEISGYKSGYRILSAIIIFFALFLLTFVGWIEFQRFQEIKGMRWEKKTAAEEKIALTDKIQQLDKTQVTLTEQLKTLNQHNAAMKTQIVQLRQENIHLAKKLTISEQEAIASLKTWETDRAKLQKQLVAAQYLLLKQNPERALEYLNEKLPVASIPYGYGQICKKLGELYFHRKNYDLARKYWQQALKLQPSTEIQQLLDKLPK